MKRLSKYPDCNDCTNFEDLGNNQFTCPYIESGETPRGCDSLETASNYDHFSPVQIGTTNKCPNCGKDGFGIVMNHPRLYGYCDLCKTEFKKEDLHFPTEEDRKREIKEEMKRWRMSYEEFKKRRDKYKEKNLKRRRKGGEITMRWYITHKVGMKDNARVVDEILEFGSDLDSAIEEYKQKKELTGEYVIKPRENLIILVPVIKKNGKYHEGQSMEMIKNED